MSIFFGASRRARGAADCGCAFAAAQSLQEAVAAPIAATTKMVLAFMIPPNSSLDIKIVIDRTHTAPSGTSASVIWLCEIPAEWRKCRGSGVQPRNRTLHLRLQVTSNDPIPPRTSDLRMARSWQWPPPRGGSRNATEHRRCPVHRIAVDGGAG